MMSLVAAFIVNFHLFYCIIAGS